MANDEQLEILKQGVEVWNKWREKNPDVKIDLAGAELAMADLVGAFLVESDLTDATLVATNLSEANLARADLTGADLSQAFTPSIPENSDIFILYGRRTDLTYANLTETNLSQANLFGANLTHAFLTGARLSGSIMRNTILVNVDLSVAIGLEEVNHKYRSSIGTDTIRKSKGKIPIDFLRGCGLSDWEIEMAKLYNPDLSNDERNQILYKIYDLQASQAVQVSPLFISYNHGDSKFVAKIGKSLTQKGIRYWRDIHDMKSGRIENQIDRAIRHNPTVLLVLSTNSIKSDWVEHEVRTARELEKELGRDTLCPIALDDSWKNSPWPKRVMEQVMEYNILDFSEWEDDVKFEGMFRRLIDGLELFYKG